MASSKKRLLDDSRQTHKRIGRALEQANVETLFEDRSFAYELIDALYDDSLDITVKTEYLAVLEQYGLDSLDAECEQVTQRLLDVLQEQRGSSEYPRFQIQLMLTLTSLLIQNDMLKSELCWSVVTYLWKVVSQVNEVNSRPLRGCACQCLKQMETWSPGLLSRYKDRLVDMMREERTHVFQDYGMLLSTVLLTSLPYTSSAASRDSRQQDSLSGQEIVRSLSLLMDQAFLFTPASLWPVVLAVMRVVKATLHVSPTIFKPLMLQNLASLDPCMLHIVLYCQKEFPGEILSADEERLLLQHLTAEVSLLTLNPAQRLLILQWLKAYLKHSSSGGVLMENEVMGRLQRSLRPMVFDSLDIQVDKLTLLISTYNAGHDHNLLKDIHYLRRLSLTTGNEWATAGLFRVLFDAYTHHQTPHVSDTIIKITGDLVVDYPHLIPLILDFLTAVRETVNDSVYLDTLSSLHNQVLNAGQAEVLAQFRFFLQVLSASAKQPHISQLKTLQFLQQLVLYAEEVGACAWEFGCAILTICRNLLLHHNSDYLYYDLGELLFEMQSCFTDTEIRNRAKLFYALLASASDEKIRDVLGSKLGGGVVLSENITNILAGSSKNKDKAQIVHLDKTRLLHWERMSVAPVFTTLESPSELAHIPDVKGGLESYYRHLSHLDTKIVYQYTLSLDENSEYEELIAVGISLKSFTKAFSPVPDVNLVSLTKLGSREVSINLVPKLPQPSIFSIQVMFSTQNHLTVSTTLQSLEVTFTDLTMTLPWQQLGVSKQQDKHCVFDELWTLITGDGSGEICYGVESVKVLKCTADKICCALRDFHIPAMSDHAVEKFLLFLPPCYHLLLRVYPQGNNQVVSMATDHWKILPCVSNFLNSLESSFSS